MVYFLGWLTMDGLLNDSQLTQVAQVVTKLMREPQPERLVFNLREASELSGVSEQQLRFAIARGELRGRRIGKGYRITRKALLDWFDRP